MKHYSIIFLLVLSMLIATPEARGADDPLTGKRLYQSFCLVCHGPGGDTRGPLAEKLELDPANLTSGKYREKSVEQMVHIIGGYGRPSSAAMPFMWKNELSEPDLRNIVLYLKLINSRSLSLKGDARNGKRLYKTSCLACHGPEGKGKGVLAKIIGAGEVGFTKGLSIKYLDDNELVEVIRDGKGSFMPGWGKTFDNEEIIDLAVYIRSLSR